ncbi:TetR/AcrR family transcriptional regulator [Phycicoccus avicenniae]|uniref:TetR/AcrR family transcriptional regulator n=1 Tax=Phycicoccus avicenniae TaxID=2828860 RepID=UPI003D2D2ABF
MSRTPSCVIPTLRDRKREQTRRALAGAAYAIVRDAGVDAVTADAVAERAGVSRRTFFNYFPSVESVLTASVADFFEALSARLTERPTDEDVLTSVLAVVDRPGDLSLVERIGVLAAAGETSAHAKGLILAEFHTWLDWFEAWLRERVGPGPTDLHVATLAGAILGCGEAAIRVWSRSVVAGEQPPAFHVVLAESLGHLRSGLLAGTPTA